MLLSCVTLTDVLAPDDRRRPRSGVALLEIGGSEVLVAEYRSGGGGENTEVDETECNEVVDAERTTLSFVGVGEGDGEDVK